MIVLKAQEDLLKKIERQLNMGVDSVTEEDKLMLEVDVLQLAAYSLSEKQYWIHAVEVARQASTRAVELLEGTTNSWNEIIKDGRFDHLPKSIPIPTNTPTAAAPAAQIATPTQTQNGGGRPAKRQGF